MWHLYIDIFYSIPVLQINITLDQLKILNLYLGLESYVGKRELGVNLTVIKSLFQ